MYDRLSGLFRQQEALLKRGAITRRSFISNSVAAGLTLSAAMGAADRVMAQTPNKGGMLRLGLAC